MAEEQELQRKLTTIMVADIVGFSTLAASDEDWTVRTLGEVRKVVDEIIKSHQGRIFNTGGDSVLAEFGSPVEAVRAAVDFQAAVRARNLLQPENHQLRFRIGLNLGDVLVRESDLLGDGVNVAARLEALAEPGGICISGTVWDHVAGKLTVAYVDLGDQFVKNIPRPIRAYHLRLEETSGTGPPKARAPVPGAAPRSGGHPATAAIPAARRGRRIAFYGVLAVAALALGAGYWTWRSSGWPPALRSADQATTSQDTTANPQLRQALEARLKSAAPTMPERARTGALNFYFVQALHKALAVPTTDGAMPWSTFSRPTADNAREAALEGCQVAFDSPCILIAIDDAAQPQPANNAWIAQDMPRTRYRGDFDPAQIPNGSPLLSQRADVAGYRSAPAFKAAAHHPGGLNMFIAASATDQRAAEIQALKLCNDDLKKFGAAGHCFLYAVGDRVVLPLRLKEPMTPATPR
jgi:adenylate cyclase